MRILCLLFLAALSLQAFDQAKFEEARALFRSNKFTEAKARFSQLVAENAGDPELLYWQGRSAFHAGELSEAESLLEKSVSLRPNHAECLNTLGGVYGSLAQKTGLFSKMSYAKKCVAAFDRAVALEPNNVEYRKSRYEFYRAAPAIVGGGNDKAEAEMAEIEKLDPVQGAGMRADSLLKADRVDEAFNLLNRLREKYPENLVPLYQLGRLSAMTGLQLESGEKCLSRYLDHHPQPADPPLWAAHWRLAQIFEKEGKTDQARTHYQQCLEMNPSFSRARDALSKLRS